MDEEIKQYFACPKCGAIEEYRMQGNMVVSFPAYKTHNITKKYMRSKDFVVWAALWETFDHVCGKCGYVRNSISYEQKMQEWNKERLSKLDIQIEIEKIIYNNDVSHETIASLKEAYENLYGGQKK